MLRNYLRSAVRLCTCANIPLSVALLVTLAGTLRSREYDVPVATALASTQGRPLHGEAAFFGTIVEEFELPALPNDAHVAQNIQ